MSKQQANLVCLLVAAIWGGGFIATDAALQTFDPFTVLMIRFIGASIVSIIVCLVSRVKISREALFRGSISGVLMYLAFAFQTFGLFFTNTGQNAFLTAVNVVLVPYIVWLLWKKKPSNHQLAASVVCLVGITCLSLSKGYFSFSFGDSLSLSCAFFFACHIISLEYATENSNSIAINAVQMSVAAILSIPLALSLETIPQTITAHAYMSCAYMIIVTTFLAFQLQTLAQKYTDASSASVLLCTESLFANVFGFLLLHEEKSPIMILGGLLIFVSIILTEYSGQFILSKPQKDSRIDE